MLVRTVPRPSDVYTQSLLALDVWNDTSISFSFPTSEAQYADYAGLGGSPFSGAFNEQQMDAVRAALKQISAFSALTFVEVSGANVGTATLRFANTIETSTAFAFLPSTQGSGGDSWYGEHDYILSPAPGNYAFMAVLHEIGHALGLLHPHEPLAGSPMPHDRDWMAYTVMSYESYIGAGLNGYRNGDLGFAQTYMMEDIAALQYAYGANFNHQSGDSVYTFSPDSGSYLIDGVTQQQTDGNVIFATIWDGGGKDTYDFSAFVTGGVIDLRPGEWSGFNTDQYADLGSGRTPPGLIANAHLFQGDLRSLIENVIGGAGNDNITGNQRANYITGGAGADIISGREGGDQLLGGGGSDYITGDWGDDLIEGGDGDDSLDGGEGNDVVFGGPGHDSIDDYQGFESQSDDVMYGGDGDDRLYGRGGADELRGGGGLDGLLGGEGDDRLFGDDGDDVLSGDDGKDLLDGGAGNDFLRGGVGADMMVGGLGDDTYIWEDVGDVIVELPNEGYDTVVSYFDIVGQHSFEVVYLQSDSTATTIHGNAADNKFYGNNLANVFRGGAGADYIDGSWGNDQLHGDAGDDHLRGDLGDDLLDGGDGFDTAIFGTDFSQNTISVINGVVTVFSESSGTDSLVSIEFLEFADGIASLASVFDRTAPQLTGLHPSDGETTVPPGSDLTFSFSEEIQRGTGTIELRSGSEAGALFEAFNVATSGLISISGSSLTINPTSDLAAGTQYFVVFAPGSIEDLAGNDFAGLNTYDFTTAPPANLAPAITSLGGGASAPLSLGEGTRTVTTVQAADPNGDALTYTIVGGVDAGRFTINAVSGALSFVDTPDFEVPGDSNQDNVYNVIVSATDGSLSDTQSLTVTVEDRSVPPRLILPGGAAAAIGGTTDVFLTSGHQDLTILNAPGTVTLFGPPGGGDTLRFDLIAADYTIVRSGSRATISDGDTLVVIPVSPTGINVEFADRTLTLGLVDGVVKIGLQVITTLAQVVTAPSQGGPVPDIFDPLVVGRLIVAEGSPVSVGGRVDVFGTTFDNETFTAVSGDIAVRAGFTDGGDRILFSDVSINFDAYRSGSTVIVEGDGLRISIPASPAGVVLGFPDGNQNLRLEAGKVLIGDQELGTTSARLSPDTQILSLDQGTVFAPALINAGASPFVFNDNAALDTHVVLSNFSDNDIIRVLGASLDDFAFSRGDGDGDTFADDLIISRTAPRSDDTIVIANALAINASVTDLISAQLATGLQVMTFA